MRKVLVDITHPAYFHFFRPAMQIWQDQGYELTIAARDKDLTLPLLDHYSFEYALLSRAQKGMVRLALEMVEHETKIWRLIRRVKPDVVLAMAGTFVVHAAALTRTPSLIFYDTEHDRLSNAITYPFATQIITPSCYGQDLGPKQLRFDGYKELAYLHPNHFTPDPAVLSELGLSETEKYALVRFVAWDAVHDRGHQGMTLDFKRRLISELSQYGRVFITSEQMLPPEFEPYRLKLPPHRIHDVLAYAQLYIGEGASMAAEAAVLGTPSIYTNPLPLGYIDELEDEYGLVFSPQSQEEALARAIDVMCDDNIAEEWTGKKDRMLADKIDVTEAICHHVKLASDR
jgi:predicted glycosyltransferase